MMVFTLVVAFQMWWLYTGMLTRVKPLGKAVNTKPTASCCPALLLTP